MQLNEALAVKKLKCEYAGCMVQFDNVDARRYHVTVVHELSARIRLRKDTYVNISRDIHEEPPVFWCPFREW